MSSTPAPSDHARRSFAPAPATRPSITVVVADDHPLFRHGLRTLVDDAPDLELVGEAATGEEAVQVVEVTRPDVVVLDLHMPGGNGLDAIGRIVAMLPDARVLVLTMADDDTSLRAALRAGARGYTLKGSPPGEILSAIRAVAAGVSVLSPELSVRLAVQPATDAVFPELTPRERDVLRLLARHRSNLAIARELDLSEKTVRNQVSVILAKLRARDREAAGLRAREAGLE